MRVNYALNPGASWVTNFHPHFELGAQQAMTQHVAYKWRGDLYCGDDIVAVFTEHFPWYVWRDMGGDPAARDGETELDEIARLFRIDRRDMWQVEKLGFPERLNDGHPGYCKFCLRWFDD